MPATERLVEFARGSMWSSMAYRQMLHSIFCPPTFEFCDENHKVGTPVSTWSVVGDESTVALIITAAPFGQTALGAP